MSHKTPKIKEYRRENVFNWIDKVELHHPDWFKGLDFNMICALREMSTDDLHLISILISGGYAAGYDDGREAARRRDVA